MTFIRRIIFQILLSIRGIVLGISKWLALICLIYFVALLFIELPKPFIILKIMVLTFGILFTLINWFYDDLIFYFKPEDMDIALFL